MVKSSSQTPFQTLTFTPDPDCEASKENLGSIGVQKPNSVDNKSLNNPINSEQLNQKELHWLSSAVANSNEKNTSEVQIGLGWHISII